MKARPRPIVLSAPDAQHFIFLNPRCSRRSGRTHEFIADISRLHKFQSDTFVVLLICYHIICVFVETTPLGSNLFLTIFSNIQFSFIFHFFLLLIFLLLLLPSLVLLSS